VSSYSADVVYVYQKFSSLYLLKHQLQSYRHLLLSDGHISVHLQRHSLQVASIPQTMFGDFAADVAAEPVVRCIQGGPKNVALYFCPYLCQLLIDLQNLQNSFTGTLCRQFAITWLLHIPPHRKCVSTLPCEISMKYAYIMIITNQHFGKTEKEHFRPTLQWMVCMTLNCVGLTQSSVIRIIHYNVGLVFFHSLKCLLLLLVFACIYILQGSVEMHLPCGGMYSNSIIANCLQRVPVKEFWKLVNNWRRYWQK